MIIGQEYQFRLRAKNIWGWGGYSSIVNIKAAKVPGQMSAPATSVDASSGDLVISWTQPDTQGSAITSYLIEVGSADGLTWTEITATCSGDNPSLLDCSVPMNSLALSPFLYTQGQLIKVRTRAFNEFGSGPISLVNTEGAKLKTVPHKMTQVKTHPDTRKDILRVQWDAPSTQASGDSNILSYKLVWNAGSGAVEQELTSVTTYYTELTYTITENIELGRMYLFKVKALNIYGWSDYSDVSTVVAAEVPSEPNIPTTTASGKNVVIAFEKPQSNGFDILSYTILIKQADGIFSS